MNPIEKLKKNPYNEVSKWNRKCPICDSDLYSAFNYMAMVFDGNTVFHCESDEGHIFWKGAREAEDVLHLNKNATDTNFDTEQDYKFEDDAWVES